MPKRTNAFQRLIAFIEKQLAPQGATVRESVLLEAKDGSGLREVDVLIEGSVGTHAIRIGLECRGHRRRQTVAWIDQIHGTYQFLPVDKVIAVSSSGFSKTALARARMFGIETYTLKEALAADWPKEFTQWKAAIFTWTYNLAAGRISFVGDDNPGLDGAALLAATIQASDGTPDTTVAVDVNRLFKNNAGRKVSAAIEKNRDVWSRELPGKEWNVDVEFFPDAPRYLVRPDGRRFQIESVTLSIRCSYTLATAEHRHFAYRDTQVTTVDIPYDETRVAQFAILHDETGKPRTMNVHLEPREGTKGRKKNTGRSKRRGQKRKQGKRNSGTNE